MRTFSWPDPSKPGQKKITLTPEALNLLSENELLPQKIDTLIKLLYGAKSEKIDPAQLQLLIEGLDPEKLDSPFGDDTQEAEGDAKKKAQSKTTKGKNYSRLKGWDSLEVVEETIFPEGYEQDKNHLPLYRQQTIFARPGLHAPRDTLNHWNLESLEFLRPIAEAIHQECLASSYLIKTMKALVEHGQSRAAELTPTAFVKARRFAKAS